MTKLTFFPVGSADTCLIELQSGERMLVDFADMADTGDDSDKRCDLTSLLSEDFEEAGVEEYRIVAFSHLDTDHCKRSSEYFWLDHATTRERQFRQHGGVRCSSWG